MAALFAAVVCILRLDLQEWIDQIGRVENPMSPFFFSMDI
jgi:hypothetical protein